VHGGVFRDWEPCSVAESPDTGTTTFFLVPGSRECFKDRLLTDTSVFEFKEADKTVSLCRLYYKGAFQARVIGHQKVLTMTSVDGP
jgi:hypothetical protein